MAKSPFIRKLSLDQFTDVPREVRPALEQLFLNMNPFISDTANALNRQLTLRDNVVAEFKTIQTTIPPLQWLEVAAAGNPAPTFLNGWTNTDPTNNSTAAVRMEPNGLVQMRGQVGGGSPNTSTIFSVPVGWRPRKDIYFAATDTNGATVDISECIVQFASGNVHHNSAQFSARLSLDGVFWEAEDPVAPLTSIGPGWPIFLTTSLSLPISSVQIALVRDLNRLTNTTLAHYNIDWEPNNKNGKNGATIRNIYGLTPERVYEITFLIFGG